MTKIAIRSITGRRMRTILTSLAIVLGVAMVSGAFTLTDTMGSAADKLTAASYSGTDAVVTAKTAFEIDNEDSPGTTPTIPASTLEQVRSVDGVELAVGGISDEAKIIDGDGEVVGGGPYFGSGVDAHTPGAAAFTPFKITEGEFASGPGQVVIDAGTADKQGLEVGDDVEIQGRGPAGEYTITGIASFGDVDSIGTATFAIFDLAEAQRVFDKSGAFDEILVGGDGSVPPPELRQRIADQVGGVKVQSAEAQDRFTLDGLKEGISFLKYILLAFGVIAVFVGAFTIFNTLSITIAQRAREFALARAIGATRRQVLRSVIVEALALGAIASVIGVAAGLGIAKGLSSLMASMGLDLPQTATVFAGRTVIVALTVGILVTVLAGLGPALRATRVAPVSIMREGAELPASRGSRRLPKIALGVIALALAVLGFGLFAPGVEIGARMGMLGPGALLLFVGVALASPRLVPPLASGLGRIAARFGGSAGRLARSNAMRNPGRTASTAASLMIGIALVAFVTVIGAGLRDSTRGALADQVRADYAVVATDGWSPIDPKATAAAAEVPGVETATGIVQSPAQAFGEDAKVDGVDTGAITQVFGFDWEDGSDATLTDLRSDQAVVTKAFADDHDLSTGDGFATTAPSGEKLELEVAGITDPDKFNALGLGEITVGRATFDSAFTAERERYGFVTVADGDSAATAAALDKALAGFPTVEAQTATEFETEQSKWVDQILAIFYVLLALAVIVSLFGIVNTMALSVVERTREIGMLKAIGMTRRQVRRMVRHESLITSLIGAVLGIAVGLFLAGLATVALSSEGLRFALPIGSLVAFTAIAGVAGTLAAILPARRAARLNPLEALNYE
jgi:putative ABC transport system permease protein